MLTAPESRLRISYSRPRANIWKGDKLQTLHLSSTTDRALFLGQIQLLSGFGVSEEGLRQVISQGPSRLVMTRGLWEHTKDPLSLPEPGKTGDTHSKQRTQQELNTVALQLLWA